MLLFPQNTPNIFLFRPVKGSERRWDSDREKKATRICSTWFWASTVSFCFPASSPSAAALKRHVYTLCVARVGRTPARQRHSQQQRRAEEKTFVIAADWPSIRFAGLLLSSGGFGKRGQRDLLLKFAARVFNAAPGVMRLKREPRKSIRSSCCGSCSSYFLYLLQGKVWLL